MGRLAGEMLKDASVSEPASHVEPLPSASVIVLRDGPLEVLMLRRPEHSSFMPGAWVFPGGVAEPGDAALASSLAGGTALDVMRVAAIRETFEESGIWIGEPLAEEDVVRQALLDGTLELETLVERARPALARLVWTSRWITPVGIPKRFDTYFFLVTVARDVIASVDEREASDSIWISPTEALARHARREMPMVFPTLRNLEAIASFATTQELIASRRNATIEPVLPILVNGRPTLPKDGR
jgi:8-oxo-dGTP pyrophosphatase MutT (NUDIX family)